MQRSKASVVRHRGFFVFGFALRVRRIVGCWRDVSSDISLVRLCFISYPSCSVTFLWFSVLFLHALPTAKGHGIEHGETQQKTRYA